MYTTEHLAIHVAPSVFMCAGTAEELELHATALAEVLDVEFDRQVPVYYGVNDGCGSFRGCTMPDGAVFAEPSEGILEHELGHAVACELSNGAAPLLSEGWATSVEPRTSPVYDLLPLPSSQLAIERPEDLSYRAAGNFVRWLVERDSVAFRRLYEQGTKGLGQVEMEALFEAIYEAPFDQLEAEFLDDLPYQYIPFRQCANLEELTWKAGQVQFEGELDCDAKHTRGPYPVNPEVYDFMYRSFVVRVEQPGSYLVNVDGGVAGKLTRCGTKHPETSEERAVQMASHVIFSDIIGAIELELEAGDWRLDIHGELGPATAISFHMWPA